MGVDGIFELGPATDELRPSVLSFSSIAVDAVGSTGRLTSARVSAIRSNTSGGGAMPEYTCTSSRRGSTTLWGYNVNQQAFSDGKHTIGVMLTV